MKTKIFVLLFLVASAIIVWQCASPSPNGKDQSDTPTSGNLKIVVDESYSKLFDTEIYTFEALYKRAKVFASYKPEAQALADLMADSCKVIIINRDLTKSEYEQFKLNNLFPKATKICEDAIALIVNPENEDSLFTTEKIKSILLGNDSVWKQINAKSNLGKINVVFDNDGSANARYMKDSLLQGKDLSKNCFAVKSNPEVVEYVASHKNAIGIISVNWISDQDDSTSTNLLKKIKVVSIAKADGMQHYKPFQAYIKTKDYAFCRDVYMVNRQTRAGLGIGFVAFVAGEKGQIIILKQGLVPSTMPVRLVQINTK